MGPKGLSQLERLCQKFYLRCHWCRKDCNHDSPEMVPRKDWMANFQKGKNTFSNLVLSCSACFWKRHPEMAPPKPKPKPETNKRQSHRRVYPYDERRFIERLVWLKTRGICFYCKNPVSYKFEAVPMIKDHHIPLCHGGADDHSNLVPSCKHCDKLKGGNLPWQMKNRFTNAPLVCFAPTSYRTQKQIKAASNL